MSDDQRNNGLHPRHPGRGHCAVIELESAEGRPEAGGFMLFLPSGETKVVHWVCPKPISPTLEAAQQYATTLAEALLDQHSGRASHIDIAGVNWTSVCAAIQRVILDWNDKITGAINAKMVRDAIEGKTVRGAGGSLLH